jgi:hypothetical protein
MKAIEKAEAKTIEIVRPIISLGIVRLETLTSSFPLRRFHINNPRMAALVVLTPPPVEPGEAPMNMRMISKRIVALVKAPDILVLDEPTSGVDPIARNNFWKLIKELAESGVTVFVTTHYMDEADFLCTRVAIMDRGKLVTVDSPENLKNSIGSDLVTLECSDPDRFASSGHTPRCSSA